MMLNELINKYEKELREILEALNSCYFEELDDYNFDDDVVYIFKDKYKKPFKSANGATKGVLIFEDYGFVIKIPFIFCDGEEMNGATEGADGWDYCSQEVARYEMAKQNGFEDIFLETSFLDTVDGHPIYIQQYAEILNLINSTEYSNNHCSSTDLDRSTVREIDNREDYDYLDSGWEADLFVKYGIQKYKNFKKYLKDNYIKDLRNSNIGYIGRNPVLVDYAGFDN